MLLLCQMQSGLLEVGVEMGDLFYFQASLEEFLSLLKMAF